MKKFLQLTAYLHVLVFSLNAQTQRDRVYIDGGDELWPNFMKEMYQYPTFQEGTVEFNSGQPMHKLLNYNKVIGNIQFIQGKDTLEIANPASISAIRIGEDIFRFNPECNQLITPGQTVKLFKNERLRIADIRQVGAFGSLNTSSAIETNNQLYTWMNTYNIGVNEKLLLGKTINFYLETANNELVPANRKNFLELAKDAQQVKDFIKEKRTNFNKEDDLIELAKFISGR